jgi:cysteine desulfurase family protein (TIGR01976 family)
MSLNLDTTSIREQFPSLKRKHRNQPMVFLDGPAGTQVPSRVINAISTYYSTSNSNTHGAFITTQETDSVINSMRSAMADLLGAPSPSCISIGQNMTTLNFALARALSRVLKPGDEVVITQLDHEANRGPWLTLSAFGVFIKEVPLLQNGTLDYSEFEKIIGPKTKLVCMGMSSNSIGTVNEFLNIRKLTNNFNALLLLDAVHYAPHFSIDVQTIDCDFLLCSAYKFYGPHVGILYSKPGALDRLPTDRLRVAGQSAPDSIETGTLNHAAIAGVTAAVDFLATLGQGSNRRLQLVDAYARIANREHELASRLYQGLKSIPGITIMGHDFSKRSRTPTVSFTLEGKTPLEVCTSLAAENICAWDGHFYALRAIEVLGLVDQGGVTRLGISVYNSDDEIEKTIREVKRIAN